MTVQDILFTVKLKATALFVDCICTQMLKHALERERDVDGS